MALYMALLRQEKDTDFGVDFPDFPGCITVGKTLEEAHKRASEALKFHIKGMLEDRDPIPNQAHWMILLLILPTPVLSHFSSPCRKQGKKDQCHVAGERTTSN